MGGWKWQKIIWEHPISWNLPFICQLCLWILYTFFLLNNCNSLASFSFRISIFKVPVFSSHPCLRVSICSMILFPIFVFFCIREENPVIFVHQLTYLLHRLFKYTGWFSLGRAIGNVNQNWSNKIWPIEKAMHLLRTFDAQAQRQLILFKSLFTTTSTRKKKTWTLCVCLYFSSEIKLTFWFDDGSIPYCFFKILNDRN